MLDYYNKSSGVIDFLQKSLASFQGIQGKWILIYIIICVGTAVFTFPKYHKKSFWIYTIALIVMITITRNYLGGDLYFDKGLHFDIRDVVAFSYFGVLHSIVFSIFYWSIIWILLKCNEDGILSKWTRLIVMIVSIIAICLSSGAWDSVIYFAFYVF